MTDREREFASCGFEYSEGIEYADRVIVPSTGRLVVRTETGWSAQPWNDNYWLEFDNLLDALKKASRPNQGCT